MTEAERVLGAPLGGHPVPTPQQRLSLPRRLCLPRFPRGPGVASVRAAAPGVLAALTAPWGAPIAVAVAGVGGCAFVALADPTTSGGLVPPCPTKALFGVTCPGCGTARMLACLLRGDLSGAAHFNAIALAALPLLLWTYAVWVWSRAAGRRVRRWQDGRWAPVAVAAVFACWFVVRMLPMEPFATLRV